MQLSSFGFFSSGGVTGSLKYEGVWNASTNTPALSSGTGGQGEYYVVSVAGSTNLDGISDWQVGDWAVFNGAVWQKIDNTDAVTSVNGQVGAVTLGISQILSQSNKVGNGLTITSENGNGYLNLREGSDDIVVLSNDNGAFTGEGIYMEDDYIAMYAKGYTSLIQINEATGQYDIRASNNLNLRASAHRFKDSLDVESLRYDAGANIMTQSKAGIYKRILGGVTSGDGYDIKDEGDLKKLLSIRGNALHEINDVLEIGKGGSLQGALRVYGNVANAQVAIMYNSSSSVIYDFRQAAGSAIAYFKNASGTNNITLNASSGIINAVGGFSTNGNTGIGSTAGTVYTFGGGASGDVASFTVARGIVTAITLVP